MIRLLTAVLLFASFHAAAEVTLTDINNNEVADADEVMGNFNALKNAVEANATAIDALPTPPTDCTTDQIIKWNGTAWECSYPLTATFSSSDWDSDGEWQSGNNIYTYQMFSNSTRGVMTTGTEPYSCTKSGRCEVGVAGVANHAGCSVSESGNSGYISAPIAQFPDMWCDTWACFFKAGSLKQDEPVTITVTCPD